MTEIPHLKKLAERIKLAIKEREKISLYLDADLDGTSAAIILKETIENLGGKVEQIYFSDRRREEPGLNTAGLNYLKDSSPGLLLVLDCGISNFSEIDLAREMGFSPALLEHHEVLDRLPQADLIVDPKQEKRTRKNDSFYDLAAVGLAFKLAELLLGPKLSGALKEDFLGLAALGTVADMVPEQGENAVLVQEGLPCLESSWRPGIRVLFESSLAQRYISTREIVQKIITVINLTDKDGEWGELYLLLTAKTKSEAQAGFEKFLQKGSERQLKIEHWFEEFKKIVWAEKPEAIIFRGNEEMPQPLLGTVCSRLCDFFDKPTFLYKKTEKENIGHFRLSDSGQSGIRALASCKHLLRRYGGHAPAGGFYFQDQDGEKLKQCLLEYFQKK